MGYLLKVLTEHTNYILDRYFYYFSTNNIFIGTRVKINFHEQKLVGFVLSCDSIENKEVKEKELGFKLKVVQEIIDEEPILNSNLLKLAEILRDKYIYPLIGVLNTMIPPSLKSSSSYIKKPKIAYTEFYELIDSNYSAKNIYEERILAIFKNDSLVLKNELGDTKALLNLIDNNVIRIIKKERFRYKLKPLFDENSSYDLNEEQERCFHNILISREKLFLIKGVTGSGKTAVYIKLIELVLKDNGSALVLVPEVALTPLMISRIASYFNEEVAILHSSLTPGEKYDEYRKISSGRARIVIGTRSAVFAPLKNLKIIIIDEEHDSSYKQEEGLAYNAKDVAIIRSRIENCKIIFGSATPSIDMMARVYKHEIHLETLNQRYFNKESNLVNLIDIKKRSNFSSNSNIFSTFLINRIAEKLQKNEQIILMVNRRGYYSSIICDDCGYVFKCPNCNLPLVYHKSNDRLLCHHCEYIHKFQHRCPNCGSINLDNRGFGIERVVEDFEKLFPNTKYVVLNSDVTKSLHEVEEVLDKFNSKKVNVLIGTQIVAKGHDFKDVSLVGILNSDNLLYYPTYKAYEETFSLLVQTIGRSGRFISGEAVLQTSKPNHKVIQYAINNDYDSFYKFEIRRRMEFYYPPFVNLISLRVCSRNPYEASKKAYDLSSELEQVLVNDHVSLSKVQSLYKNYYSYRITIKTKNIKVTRNIIYTLIKKLSSDSKLRIFADVNPYNI